MDIYNDFSEENNVIAVQILVARYENGMKVQKVEYFDIDEIEMLVSHYVENGMFDKALEVIKAGKSIHSTYEYFLYQEANLLLAVNKPSEMLFLVEKHKAISSEERLLLQSRAYLMLKNVSQALICFDQLLKELYLKSKSDENVILYFAKALITENQPLSAIPYLKRLLTSKVQQETQELLLNCYQLSGQNSEAKIVLQQWIEQDPENDKYWTELGITCSKLEEVDKALYALETAVALNKENTTSLKALADIFVMQGKFDLALENLNAIVACDGICQDILTDIGHIYYLKKEYEKSLTTYIHAILENPYSCYEYMEVARILTEKPDINLSEILQDIRLQYNDSKASSDSEELLNSLYYDLQHKIVENWIQKAIALDFQNQYDFRYYYGQWLLLHHRKEEAQQQLQKVTEQNPHHVQSWEALVALSDNISQKITLLSSAIQYNFNDDRLYFLLADYLNKIGDKAQAKHYLQLGLKLNPNGFIECNE